MKSTDAEGRSKVNQYTFVKQLGEGTYGKVKLVLYGNEEHKCAVKVIRKDLLKKRREMFRDEKGSEFHYYKTGITELFVYRSQV
jgi:serine/threonine protein kinase